MCLVASFGPPPSWVDFPGTTDRSETGASRARGRGEGKRAEALNNRGALSPVICAFVRTKNLFAAPLPLAVLLFGYVNIILLYAALAPFFPLPTGEL